MLRWMSNGLVDSQLKKQIDMTLLIKVYFGKWKFT